MKNPWKNPMKQCTQSPATTGLVVTYSKFSPNTSSFLFLGTQFCVDYFCNPYTCITPSGLLRFCTYTHSHITHIQTHAYKTTTRAHARAHNNFARHLIFLNTHCACSACIVLMYVVLHSLSILHAYCLLVYVDVILLYMFFIHFDIFDS